MLLCREEKLFQRAICLGDITRILELPGPEKRFAATSFGIKTRIAPLSAAVARVQLRHLVERNQKRNENLVYLSRALETMGFHTFMPPPYIHRTYFEFIVRYKPQNHTLPIEQLITALQAEGSRVSIPRYPLLHQQPFSQKGTSEQSPVSPRASFLRTIRPMHCRRLKSKVNFFSGYQVSPVLTNEYWISISKRLIKSCHMPVPFIRRELWSTLVSYFLIGPFMPCTSVSSS